VRALVNAVDHLGTVAYKLTDLLEQQALEVSTMEVKVSCMNQVIFNICLSGCLSIRNHNHKKWMDFNIFSFVAISNILHAKHIRIRKVFDSSSCWHSSQDITSTTFYKVILNFWLLYKCVSMCWRILSFSHSFFPLVCARLCQ
jgi:hypothetical protein